MHYSWVSPRAGVVKLIEETTLIPDPDLLREIFYKMKSPEGFTDILSLLDKL